MNNTDQRQQGQVLIALLLINAVMFVIEGFAGWLSESTALMADSLDMLADASVYGVSLYAVGKTARHKAQVALISGIVEVLMGLAALYQVIEKWLWGSQPLSGLMMGVGMLALLANVVCVVLISRYRHGDVHLRASYIFSKNDVIANLGVILAGLLVAALNNRWPDLVIGLLIALVVLRGGGQILRESSAALSAAKTTQGR